jgi:UDP-N-acetylmuramoyl-tripeptide--D-alanyl-D-alanine ligase
VKTEFWTEVSGGQWLGADVPPWVSGISNDSRTIKPGECFLAIEGVRDGHDFVADAERYGAGCVILSRAVEGVRIAQLLVRDVLTSFRKIVKAHRNSFRGPVIGLTGSYGKTSTKDTMHLLFGPKSLATVANLNNTLGVPLTLSKLNEHNDIGIIECGVDRFGEMEEILDVLNPTIGIVTGLTPVHSSQFGSMEKIAEEKSKMLIHALVNKGLAIFPEECVNFKQFKEIESKSWIVSSDKKAENYITYARWADGVVVLSSEFGEEFYPLPAMSDGQVRNCAISIFLARKLGIDHDALVPRLMRWKPSKMRGEIIKNGEKTIYLDCYNANPASMMDAISNFKKMFPNPCRTFIIGCMLELGDGSRELHNSLGENLLPAKNDIVLLIGEWADHIKHGIERSGSICENIHVFGDTTSAAKTVGALASNSIFVKGSSFYKLCNLLPAMGIKH